MFRMQAEERSRYSRYISLAIAVVLLAFYFLVKQYPKLLWLYPFVGAGAVCVRQIFVRRVTFVSENPSSDTAFKWMANAIVLLLIFTYCTGYFLLAAKAHFALSIVAIFVTVLMISGITGSRLRRYISPATLLAYGLSFTVGLFLAALMLYVVVGSGRTLSQMS